MIYVEVWQKSRQQWERLPNQFPNRKAATNFIENRKDLLCCPRTVYVKTQKGAGRVAA